MRLQELFLVETTEEDREIINLANDLFDIIATEYEDINLDRFYPIYYDDEEDAEHHDLDYDDLDIEDQAFEIGTIGDIVETPLTLLNPVTIELQSDYGIRQRMKKERGADIIHRPGEEDILGLWYGEQKVLVINTDDMESPKIRSIIAHELRHALDDFKSDFRALDSKRYTTPRKKEHQDITGPRGSRLPYLAEPAEIHGRFLQVLHDLVPIIKSATTMPPEKTRPYVIRKFDKLLQKHNIAFLFPEKTQSKDYRKLLKRGVDFIDKELAKHQK